MAHCTKIKKGGVAHMSAHYRRDIDKDTGEFVGAKSHNIDPDRTHLNYNLASDDLSFKELFLRLQADGVKARWNRSDYNLLVDWVCTAPQDLVKDHPEQLEEFFNQTFDFIRERYKLDDRYIQSAYVHMDEATPHMHFAFAPVVEQKDGTLKLSAKDIINRADLNTFHHDYESFLQEHGFPDIQIMNEATKDGNKTVTELKRESELEKQNQLIRQTDGVKNQYDLYAGLADKKRKEYEEWSDKLENVRETVQKAQEDVLKASREAELRLERINADMDVIEEQIAPFKELKERFKAIKEGNSLGIRAKIKDHNDMTRSDYNDVLRSAAARKKEYDGSRHIPKPGKKRDWDR